MKVLRKSKETIGLSMENADTPKIQPDELLIKIHKTAICGTDIHIYNWDEWAQKVVPVPLITGHEFVGVVVEVGSQVRAFQVGQRVSGEGHLICGACRNCRGGTEHLCRNTISVGVTRQGAFAEYLALPARNAYLIPDAISDDVASMLDPLGNAVHTALSFNLVGEDVLITGAGPIGCMAAAVAKFVGARHVVVTDVNDYRLSLAQKLNHTAVTVNPLKQDLRDIMQQLGMREGFDVGLEVSGNATAFNQMIDTMNHGGRIAMLGFVPNDTHISWNQIIMKGLFLKGIYGREMYETWYKMINMLLSGLDVSPIITHHFNINDYEQGFEVMRSGRSGKVILDWTASHGAA